MHFAMPPRKTSRPPPYAARQSRGFGIPPALRNILRDRSRGLVVLILGFFTLFWLLGGMSGGERSAVKNTIVGSGAPVVIVTTIDPTADLRWVERIKKNREDYAKKHGYATFFPSTADYPLKKSPPSWAKVPALRHAMTLNPTSQFFWYLDSTALIANPSISLQSHILDKSRLEKLMIVNEPVVPPDSVIKTFGNLKGDRIDVIVSQDKEGLCVNSLFVKQGEWAKYFLDAWFDPIYRSYNFQKAEAHALEHIVQWHGTILAKLALVPQDLFNSYVTGPASPKNGQYKDGDLIASFPGCDKEKRDCAEEMEPTLAKLEGKDKD
ncbi:alpha-1,6-mannosyltransferas-like protein subunit [Polyplosphaeria fusca]|uniref:Alpha-1,6-mannosyltransferas-like protein subunit n=1 Tax=Polyplosphaeria fusca TaxID=682080 RepID=A0A9P4QT76_9PLEO|nr:alpha-1,6-mannosyltransferas-like protein subunit [Polyplosphaeria fusca]